jgi:adenylate kinase
MLNIVLFGPPGAGKGTQSEKLIEKYDLVHLSTGDILRGEISAGTALGMEAKKLMDAGILVPDSVVIGMISAKLDANRGARGFIFDGFPRTTAQAEALDMLLYHKGTTITMMLALEVSDEELTKRLLLRGANSGREDDRNEDIIRNRINEYNNKTAPLKQYYTSQGKYHSVYGIGEVDDIFGALCDEIDASYIAPEPTMVIEESVIIEIPETILEEELGIRKPESEKVKKASPTKEKNTAEKKAPVKKKPAAKKPAAKKKPAKKVKKAAPKKAKKAAPKKAKKKAAPKKAKKKAAKKQLRPSGRGKGSAKKKIAPRKAKKAAAKKVKAKKAKKASPKKAAKKKTAKKKSRPSGRGKAVAKKKSAPKRTVKKKVKAGKKRR